MMTTNDESDRAAFDAETRRYIYDHTMREGVPPSLDETSRALSRTADETRESFRRLAEARVIVMQRGSDEILMANPFSAVPTSFLVKTDVRDYYGNCIWDSLGIPCMLKRDALIETSCGCCGAAMNVEVKGDALASGEGVVHFAVPAAKWWEDIVFN